MTFVKFKRPIWDFESFAAGRPNCKKYKHIDQKNRIVPVKDQ